MTRPARKPLQDRLTDIERRLEVLESVARSSQSTQVASAVATEATPPTAPLLAASTTVPPPPPPDAEPRVLDVERLFRWAGGILVVLAAAFLLSVALERGWLTPLVRLAGGLAIGATLMGLGVGLRRRSDGFATTLLTTGAVITYLMLWAGYEAYGLIGSWVAGGGMLLVVVGLFVEVFRSNDVALSVLATLGGFATPFLLAIAGESLTDAAGVSVPLVAYLGVFVVLTAVVHAVVGWRLLQLFAAGGAVLAGGFVLASSTPIDGVQSGAVAMTAYSILVSLGYWAVPALLRPGIEARRAGRAPALPLSRAVDDALGVFVRLAGFVLLPVLLAVVSSQWGLDPDEAGVVALVLAVAAGLVGAFSEDLDDVVNWLLSAVLLAIGLLLLVDADYHALVLVGEGTAILVANHFARGHRANAVAGHVAVGIGSLIAGIRLLSAFGGSGAAIPLAAALVVALLGTAGWATGDRMRLAWWSVGYAGALLLVRHLFGASDVGVGLTTSAWAIVGLGLVIVGRRRFGRATEFAGLLSLGAVAVRLLEHLDDLEPLVRVAVFLGIGALFLVGGWYLRSSPEEDQSEVPDEESAGV